MTPNRILIICTIALLAILVTSIIIYLQYRAFAQSVQEVHKAMIGNVTLGKEIQADPTRLQQLLQDTKQYESDSQNAITNANDIRILHDMCSYAEANPTVPMSMIAPDCNQTVTTK